MNVTLTRETAHRFSVRWMPRPDFVQVAMVSGPDTGDAIANAKTLLAANGLAIVEGEIHDNGNATLVVEEVEQ